MLPALLETDSRPRRKVSVAHQLAVLSDRVTEPLRDVEQLAEIRVVGDLLQSLVQLLLLFGSRLFSLLRVSIVHVFGKFLRGALSRCLGPLLLRELFCELELVGFAVEPKSVLRHLAHHQKTLVVSRQPIHKVLPVNVSRWLLYPATGVPAATLFLLTRVLFGVHDFGADVLPLFDALLRVRV